MLGGVSFLLSSIKRGGNEKGIQGLLCIAKCKMQSNGMFVTRSGTVSNRGPHTLEHPHDGGGECGVDERAEEHGVVEEDAEEEGESHDDSEGVGGRALPHDKRTE